MTAHHVLVVEDNTMNVDLLRENLEEAGYVFSLAVNGAAGVALANEQLPDLILMDVHLPILDGLSATKLLKKHTLTQGIPIIALTARAMAGDREPCMAAGCDDYISKPVDMALLLAKMKLHLDRRPQPFVDMIRRRRGSAEPKLAQPGMAARDYEEELLSLNSTIRRMEAELDQVRSRLAAVSAERDRLTFELGLAQRQIDTLEQQVGERAPEGQDPTLQKENERLRAALLELHRSLTEATEATHSLAFPSR